MKLPLSPEDIDAPISGLGAARWIWGGDNPRPINAFRLFRREFTLEEIPERAELWAFAEFRYKLYINGKFVQVGPTPCQPGARLLDRHEVSRFLRRGVNCIGFVVHCPGLMTGQWTLVNPALLASLRSSDEAVNLSTDGSWETISAQAWRHPTQFCGYAKGFHEWQAIAEMPRGWSEAGFQGEAWTKAKELPFYAHGQPDELRENYIGYPTLAFQGPAALVKCGLADGVVTEQMRQHAIELYTVARNRFFKLFGKWNLENIHVPLQGEAYPEPIAERAHFETHLPAPSGMVEAAVEGAVLPVRLHCPAQGHPFVVFDLGVVRAGMLTVEIESESGGTVDVAWDDRIEKDGRVALFRATPNCDRVEVPAGRVRWDGFFDRGARYLHLVLRNFRGRVTIHQAGVVETLTVADAGRAEFESDDELLNRVWRAASETTRLYMNGCAAGDPTRERVHWLHDDTLATRMAFYCFGDWKTWRRALELTAQGQNGDGFFPVISPGHFEDFNMIIVSCYWSVQQTEYLRHTGDKTFAANMFPHVVRHVAYELRFADGEGLLYETPGRRFLSWADADPRTPYQPGETWAKKTRKSWGDFFSAPTRGFNAIINIYWIWCLREAAALAEQLGQAEEAKKWRRIGQTAREAFERRFWDEETGLYRDNVAFNADGKINPPSFCESTLFHMMRAGLLDSARGAECLDRIFDPAFVCCRSSGGLELGALPPFLIEAGRTREALEFYRDRWGAPVRHGATTSGEEFFVSGGNSDCHIHGATPARDLIECVAGIRIAGPFWSSVCFAPPKDGPDLKCSVPTPHGRIEVEIRTKRDGKRVFHYRAPAGCKVFRRVDGVERPLENGEGSFPLEPAFAEPVHRTPVQVA
jgi:hypothetical protein